MWTPLERTCVVKGSLEESKCVGDARALVHDPFGIYDDGVPGDAKPHQLRRCRGEKALSTSDRGPPQCSFRLGVSPGQLNVPQSPKLPGSAEPSLLAGLRGGLFGLNGGTGAIKLIIEKVRLLQQIQRSFARRSVVCGCVDQAGKQATSLWPSPRVVGVNVPWCAFTGGAPARRQRVWFEITTPGR